MKTIISLTAILLFSTGLLYGQLDTFNLSKYKLPDMKRRQLDLNIDMSSLNVLNKSNTENNEKGKYSSNTLEGIVKLDYIYYHNSNKIQSDQQYSIGFQPYYKSQHYEDTAIDRTLTLTAFTDVASINRLYFQNQYFFEPDVNFFARPLYENDNSGQDYPNHIWKYFLVEIEVPLLIGKGRIEQIQDARLAIYILEDLYKAGRIARMPDNEEILEFAALISEVKNERFFDYRIKKMYEIEKVDSFLQSNALINMADARYFTTVNDNWDYSSSPVRESGKRISLGFAPNLYYIWSGSHLASDTSIITQFYKAKHSKFGIKALAKFDAAKPVDLHWQKKLSANISFGVNKDIRNDLIALNTADVNSLDLAASFAYEVGYFPNSRTDLSGQVNLDFLHSYQKFFYLFQPIDKERYTNITPRFKLNLHYYISPQARLNVNYQILYSFANSDILDWYSDEFTFYKTNSIYQNLTISFLYSFF